MARRNPNASPNTNTNPNANTNLNSNLTLDLLNPKSMGFDIVEDYWCAKFQVIPVRGFRFIELTYPHTYAHTHSDKVIAIPAPPYTMWSASIIR